MDAATKSDLAFLDYLRPLLKANGFEVIGVTSCIGQPGEGSVTARVGNVTFSWEAPQWAALRPVFEFRANALPFLRASVENLDWTGEDYDDLRKLIGEA